MQTTIYTVSLISIENKCLYYGIRDLKRKKKSLVKGELEPGSTVLKDKLARDLPSAPLELVYYISTLLFYLSFLLYMLIDSYFVQSAVSRQTNGAASNYTYLFRFV